VGSCDWARHARLSQDARPLHEPALIEPFLRERLMLRQSMTRICVAYDLV